MKQVTRLFICISLPSDVWALGCLLYELYAGGEFLYEEAQHSWANFFVRLVEPPVEMDILPDNTMKRLKAAFQESTTPRAAEQVEKILRFVLIRDQRLRPTPQALSQVVYV